MTKIEITKAVISTTAGIGIGRTLRGVVATFAPTERFIDRVVAAGAVFVVGSMINEQVRKYVDREVDEAVDIYNKYVTK